MSDPTQVLSGMRQLRTLFGGLTYPNDVLGRQPDVRMGVQLEGDDMPTQVYVGWSGDPGDLTMSRFTRAWRGIGAKRQSEPFDVYCSIVVFTGDDDPAALDDVLLQTAFDVLAPIDAALRADPGMGRGGPFIATLTSGEVVPDPSLLRVRLPFVVNMSGRI